MGVEHGFPRISIIWAYEGRNKEARLQAIAALKYPGFEIIEAERVKAASDLIGAISPSSEVCVFWADDDKPIASDFLNKMIQPLNSATAIHLWGGNALAVNATRVRDLTGGEFIFTGRSFLKVMLPFLEGRARTPGARSHVALSSTERLAPLCIDPVGLPC